MTTNTTDVQDNRTGRGAWESSAKARGTLDTGLERVTGSRCQSFHVAHKGRSRPSITFKETQKLWKSPKLQGLSHWSSRWGGGEAPKAPQPPPFLKGPVVLCSAVSGERGTRLSNLGTPPNSPSSFDWPSLSLGQPVRSLLPRRSSPPPPDREEASSPLLLRSKESCFAEPVPGLNPSQMLPWGLKDEGGGGGRGLHPSYIA